MKVLLIQPYITIDLNHDIRYLQEPMGLLSIATYIENKLGDLAKISVLDLFELGKGRLNNKVTTFRTSFTKIMVTTSFSKNSETL